MDTPNQVFTETLLCPRRHLISGGSFWCGDTNPETSPAERAVDPAHLLHLLGIPTLVNAMKAAAPGEALRDGGTPTADTDVRGESVAKRGPKKPSEVVDYRHDNATRVNIPPAGLAARGTIVREGKARYSYNPHLTPTLRFDGTGKADRITELLEAAKHRQLTDDEVKLLQEAFRNHEPWLEWAGKREQQACVADPVALHIHERISAQAILRTAAREDVQRDLFADPQQEYREAVQFYKHPMDWTNRMILGDSLSVMSSLARREGLAGKVQMIYMDPPYGIKYSSNFQPEVGQRDVKDREQDLTRELEMVKAYRDTWTLGVHSYLAYVRDRLLLCRELLSDTGSVFVQIGDENLHRVRSLLDEVFGASNAQGMIVYRTSVPLKSVGLASISDHVLWYSKDTNKAKRRELFADRESGEGGIYVTVEEPSGHRRSMTTEEKANPANVGRDMRVFGTDNLVSTGYTATCIYNVSHQGMEFSPKSGKSWKTNEEGMRRLLAAMRTNSSGRTLRAMMYLADYPVQKLPNLWTDIKGETDKQYVVQTPNKVIQRCLLMTTDPGDLVLDPTCGGGSTAYIAEQWGRRWITIDVSRVALAIARQRLLTATYDYYELRPTSAEDAHRSPNGTWLADPGDKMRGACTFDYKTVPHITLGSIAQNRALDAIFDKWQLLLDEKLEALNEILQRTATEALRKKLNRKLMEKQKKDGRRAVTDADARRWTLPPGQPRREKYTTVAKDVPTWYEWEVPFDTDPDWPKPLQIALTEYRAAWREKMDEVNECIAARADQEELVDQPVVDRNKVRVSGPFTMEGVIPAEESIDTEGADDSPIGGAPEELDTFEEDGIASDAQNTEAYLDRMVRLLRGDGIRFPDNKVATFAQLESLADGSILHAQGTWGTDGEERRVTVMIGPQYGPLIAVMVEEGIRAASRRGYDDLVFAAFSFDGAAQAAIQDDPDPQVRIHMAQIRPDVNMGDLLKNTSSSQLFTVSGMPRTKITLGEDGQYVVHMEGVDIYDPVTNTVQSTGADKVAAWFLDSDYDGRCFCVTQAFFPDRNAWGRLGKALSGTIDPEAFDKLSGTESLPFSEGVHKRAAVKVIDPRGNEVMRVHRFGASYV